MGKVAYLTGIPASGKTTLGKRLSQLGQGRVIHFSYSDRLVSKTGFTREELRAQSGKIVTPEMVNDTDAELVEHVAALNQDETILIDSHAVTYETYGLRAIPFSASQRRSLGIGCIICLTAPPEVIVSRIATDPCGRTVPSIIQVDRATRMQESLAVSYSVDLGIPIHLLDATQDTSDLVTAAASILGV